jgi:hypothetical protein
VEIVRSDSESSYFRGATDGERIVTSALEAPIEGMRVRTNAGESESSTLATVDDGDDA